jgi:hypothetical protein
MKKERKSIFSIFNKTIDGIEQNYNKAVNGVKQYHEGIKQENRNSEKFYQFVRLMRDENGCIEGIKIRMPSKLLPLLAWGGMIIFTGGAGGFAIYERSTNAETSLEKPLESPTKLEP